MTVLNPARSEEDVASDPLTLVEQFVITMPQRLTRLFREYPLVQDQLEELSTSEYIRYCLAGDTTTQPEYHRRLALSVTLMHYHFSHKGFTFMMTTMPEIALGTSYYLLGQLLDSQMDITEDRFHEFFVSAMLAELSLHTTPSGPFETLETVIDNLDLSRDWMQNIFTVPWFQYTPAIIPTIH